MAVPALQEHWLLNVDAKDFLHNGLRDYHRNFLLGTLFLAKKPELGRLAELSKVIRSESGEVINLRLTASGHWREPVDINRIDPLLVNMLVAYEDQRFWQHHGVDPRNIESIS